jgi:hypothetical protein
MRNSGICHNVSFGTFTGRRSDCIQLAWSRWPSGAPLLTTEDMMRIMTLAVAAVLAVSFAVPAWAAKRKPAPTTASFEKCEQLAIERGLPHGQTGHTEFVQQCMGQRPKGRSTG